MTFEGILFKSALRRLKTYKYYLINSSLSVFIYFTFSNLINHPQMTRTPYNKFIDIIGIFRMLVLLITIFFIFNSVSLFTSLRNKEFGIFKALGVKDKEISKILILESLIIGILSLIIGITFGIVFSKFFLVTFSSIIGLKDMNFYFPEKAIKNTITIYAIIFIIIPSWISRKIKKKDTYSLLKDINKKRETWQKIKIIDFILFIIISLSIMYLVFLKKMVIYKIYLMFILLLLNDYLLFKSVFTTIIKILQKIKNVYLKGINMIILKGINKIMSNMASSLIICSLFLNLSFFLITVAYVEKSVFQKELEKTIPFTYSIIYEDSNRNFSKENSLEEILKREKFKFEKEEIKFLTYGEGEKQIVLFSNKDYNLLTRKKGGKAIQLKGNEGTYINTSYNKLEDVENMGFLKSINIKDKNIKINNYVVDNFIYGIYYGIHNYNTYIISDDLFDSIKNTLNHSYYVGYKVENWTKLSKIQEYIDRIFPNDKDSNITFLTRVNRYSSKQVSANITLYFESFIAILLYFMSFSIIHFSFYNEVIKDQTRYGNMISMGVTNSELKKIVTRELFAVVFLTSIVGIINNLIFMDSIKIMYEINVMDKAISAILFILIINLIYIFTWRYINIDDLVLKVNNISSRKISNE